MVGRTAWCCAYQGRQSMQLGAQVASVAQTWVGRFHRVQASQFLRRFFVFFDKRFQFLLYVEQLGRHGTDACEGFGVLACSFGVHVKHHGRRQGAVVFQDGLQVRGVAIQECPIPRVKVLQHLAMALSFFDARALSSGQAIDARGEHCRAQQDGGIVVPFFACFGC